MEPARHLGRCAALDFDGPNLPAGQTQDEAELGSGRGPIEKGSEPDGAAALAALAEDRRPIPVRAAIAHLCLESIHPFSDGNGRIGRALVEHVFALDAALPFSLSRQIEADKQGYYAALQAGRRAAGEQIDATAFVLWFLDRLAAGIAEDEAEARFLVARNGFFLRFSAQPPRGEIRIAGKRVDGPMVDKLLRELERLLRSS